MPLRPGHRCSTTLRGRFGRVSPKFLLPLRAVVILSELIGNDAGPPIENQRDVLKRLSVWRHTLIFATATGPALYAASAVA